jgi:hypothetical protein
MNKEDKDKTNQEHEITREDIANSILFRTRCKRCGKIISLLVCDFDQNENPICKNNC